MFETKTIGVLGGGQLGKMIIQAGKQWGHSFVSLDPDSNCPAGQVADEHIPCTYTNLEKASVLVNKCDMVVYEFENIAWEMITFLEDRVALPQGSKLIKWTSDRLLERENLEAAGLPVAPYESVTNKKDLQRAINTIGFPSILKTTRGGYDGKGQWKLNGITDLKQLPDEMFAKHNFILEKFIAFAREISVIAARSSNGEITIYSPVINLSRSHILHMTAVGKMSGESIAEATEIAHILCEKWKVVGLIAIEMFELSDGSIIVNECAPRPHNSGHFTLDVCYTSQFEQLLRAVLGYPLGLPDLLTNAVMINIMGEDVIRFQQAFSRFSPRVKIHWYGKQESRAGRKMGHLTVQGDDVKDILTEIDNYKIWSPLSKIERQMLLEEGS